MLARFACMTRAYRARVGPLATRSTMPMRSLRRGARKQNVYRAGAPRLHERHAMRGSSVWMTPLTSESFVRSLLSSRCEPGHRPASLEDDLSGEDELEQLRCPPRIDRVRIVPQGRRPYGPCIGSAIVRLSRSARAARVREDAREGSKLVRPPRFERGTFSSGGPRRQSTPADSCLQNPKDQAFPPSVLSAFLEWFDRGCR